MSEDTRKTIFLVAATLTLVAIPTIILVPWAALTAQANGHISIAVAIGSLLGPIGGLAAFAAIFANGLQANRSFELTRRNGILSTFQKGAEMLVESSEASSNAGVAVLRSIAETDETYVIAVTSALASFATERERTKWAASLGNFATMGRHDVPDSSPSALRSVEAVSMLFFPKAPPLYPINRPYFASMEYTEGKFGGLSMRNARFHHFLFTRCWFTNSVIAGRVGEALIFDGCNFGGANFSLLDLDDLPITPEQSHRVAFVNTGESQHFFINGTSFEEWRKRAPPPPTRNAHGEVVS